MPEQLASTLSELSPDPGGVMAATKLHIPAARHGLVRRGMLVSSLTGASDAKLTLVAAPPGAGKTMLMSEWHASPDERRPFAWLSVDEADNDPVRFWSGVVHALQTVDPEIGVSALATIRTRGVGLVSVGLPLLINDLAALERDLVLVLDDYHLIRESRIHDSVEALIDNLPGTTHLAIATRIDPPLPLGRYRAQGDMTEIRAPDLSFTEEEAAAVLNDALGLDLEPQEIAHLQRRTEGWAAGLYLAALSLHGRSDISGFIDSFAGDDRQIVDYLVPEVLAVQPDDLRGFLLETSILERLSGPLCDAVLARDHSARMLERIERSNLFLEPLDHNRVWYRYHGLFRELLQRELALAQPEAPAELHRRACCWYLEREFVPDAIHHAVAAGDVDQAREIVAIHWNDYFNHASLETVASWLDLLSKRETVADPRLCVAGAWLSLDQGRLEEASDWIQATEAAAASGEADSANVQSDIAVLRAVHSFKAGDLGAGETAARRVFELEPEGDSWARFVASCVLGVTLHWRGAPQEAMEALEEAVRMARETGNDLGRSYALGYLALAATDRRELDEAAELADAALGPSEDPGVAEHFVTMIGHLARGVVAEARGRLEDAEGAFHRAVELSGRGAGRLESGYALLALARVQHALGRAETAKDLLRNAQNDAGGLPRPRPAASGGRRGSAWAGGRRAPSGAGPARGRGAHRPGARGAAPFEERSLPTRDRGGALRVREHCQDPRPGHLPKARRLDPRAGRHPRPGAGPAVGE